MPHWHLCRWYWPWLCCQRYWKVNKKKKTVCSPHSTEGEGVTSYLHTHKCPRHNLLSTVVFRASTLAYPTWHRNKYIGSYTCCASFAAVVKGVHLRWCTCWSVWRWVVNVHLKQCELSKMVYVCNLHKLVYARCVSFQGVLEIPYACEKMCAAWYSQKCECAFSSSPIYAWLYFRKSYTSCHLHF